MQFYARDLEKTLKKYAKFKVIALLGPRQSGKTTLAKHTFDKHVYVNLDDIELLTIIKNDPKSFFRKYENEHGIIIDEFQNFPELLSYIKIIVDEINKPGYFVLTGSQNFLMNEAITQSLAGRVAILTLLPFSLHELQANKLLKPSAPEETIFRGGYPGLYINHFEPKEVYPSYIRAYVERDVRQLINVVNLYTFQKFMALCAARVGQLLNYSNLAVSCGISEPTVHKWLSILETSYIIFLLRPYSNNFNKRATQTPKIYFYDTGLACALLEIQSSKSLPLSTMYGHLFENLIITDLYKQYYNQGLPAPLYFWRDKNGEIEVDCLINNDHELIPLEIKAGETFDPSYFKSLSKWNTLAKNPPAKSSVVYGGTQSFEGPNGNLIPWDEAGNIIKKIAR